MASKADIAALLQPTVMGLAMMGTAFVTFFALIFGPTAPYGR